MPKQLAQCLPRQERSAVQQLLPQQFTEMDEVHPGLGLQAELGQHAVRVLQPQPRPVAVQRAGADKPAVGETTLNISY